ncbi:ABC transporter C family protein (macronuclear) [Tetrahymena thermophila SB210]|uniref:ABC transporter C family protein n=1 Tax=Tetrahymena thermophila (strain SB210) TaxID=312017 RepID=I7MKD3_TETTS|nr:ABC transporter C family protein [Tetrahymena thermophila SB210]EAR98208.2 ABC transporter C family protein [Tetrahymena thermophila SB210]|eukprot:XP_001018453.2 ABC transporter C family protein [Tetrahymena thermophila SB210]
MQTQLRYLILEKSFRIQCFQDSDQVQSKIDQSQLMAVDTKGSALIYYGLVEMITSTLTLVVIIYFVYVKLGAKATLNGLIVLIIALSINIFIHRSINILFRKKKEMTDKRVSLTKDVVEGIKSIKYLGWEQVFLKKIEQAREKEFNLTRKIQLLDCLGNILWISLGYILLYVFLSAYSDEGNDVLKQNIFTVLALFAYIKQPLGTIPYGINFFLKAKVQINRIDSFLQLKEISQIGYHISHKLNSQNAITIINAQFFWPSNDKRQKKLKQELKFNEETSTDLFEQEQEGLNHIEKRFSVKVPDLQIKQGSLNVIIGEIGSGKTALLLSILNELDHCQLSEFQEENKIEIYGTIGYVSQNHWLQNKTIQENILFGEKFDQQWYNQCIKACELDEDFRYFSESDQKIIGPVGSNLSGGQRQRISLCRAVYQRKDIYLFDDIFSSLDAKISLRVYEQVVIHLLNQVLGSTILIVSSHYQFIDLNRQNLNLIYVTNGNIIQNKQIIQQYLNDYQIQTKQDNEEYNQKSQKQLVDQEDQNLPNQNLNNIEKINEKNGEPSQIQQNKPVLSKKNEEEREKGNINRKTLISFFRSRGFLFSLIHLFLSFSIQASQMLTDFWLKDYTRSNISQSSFQQFLSYLFGGFNEIFKALTLINFIIAFLCGFFHFLSSNNSSQYLFKILNKQIIFSKMVFFDKNPIGRILSRVSSDQSKIDDILQTHYHIFLEKLAYLIGYPIGMIIQFPWTILHFTLIILLAIQISKRYRASSRELTRLHSVNQGQMLTVISENSSGLSVIRSMNKERIIMQEFIQSMENNNQSQIVQDAVSVWFVMRLFILSNSSFLIIVISNLYIVFTGQEVTGNTVALGLIYSMLFSTVFSDVMNYFNYFEQDVISVERINQYLDNPLEDLQSRNSISNDQQFRVVFDEEIVKQKSDEDFAISFKNVYLSYSKNNDNFALKNISFDIKRGEKIAFCGRTGSGKTSILNALFRLYEINSGQIYLNQKNSNEMTLQELREQLSIIPQYGFLFNSTMQENLDPQMKKAKEEMIKIFKRFECLKVLEQSNSKQTTKQQNKSLSDKQTGIKNSYQELQQIEKECSSQKENEIKQQQNDSLTNYDDNSQFLDMLIQESGKNLSNGEKQIINFFRIILRNNSILCLDEATSNMDPKTDKILHEELFKFSENKTLIVITHRLENIEMFDRVYVMDKGEIVEQGHASELKKIQNGFFNKLLENKI